MTGNSVAPTIASLRGSSARPAHPRKRVLIVNCYFDDESRQPQPRKRKLPKPMGTVYLAGAFARESCEVRVYCETYSGPLDDPGLLGWPDMLVLTGLTTAFDRMLHLTAYARTLNEDVIVVAGGPAIRALPRYSKLFFNYPCTGDVEQLREVIGEAFGRSYVAEEMFPRFDLAYWIGRVGEMESSRNCNFRCSFCTLTGEGRSYQKYGLEAIRRQILAMGKHEFLFFIDNNFYGSDRIFFLERMDLLRDCWRRGHFEKWGALVTNDFFLRDENLTLARESGCTALFSGVESFSSAWLKQMNKFQNSRAPQIDTIRTCLEAGIVFLYGLMLDVTTRSVADLRNELEFITGSGEITLPAYLSLPVPYPGTPYFQDCLAKDLFLPRISLRDLDSTTLVLQPRDSFGEVCQFLDDIHTMRGFRRRIVRHSLSFAKRYRRILTPQQLIIAFSSTALLSLYSTVTTHSVWSRLLSRAPRRTYIGTTEPLDATYTPAFPVASRYAHYFKPTLLTDDKGHLTEELAEDLQGPRAAVEAASSLVSVTTGSQ
jgi:hopanoid C-2 methylase